MEYRYMPAVAELVRLVGDGVVGTPRMLAIREHRFPFLTKVDNWNRFSANTGGTLVEKACHYFDLMNLIIGERPSRVYASGAQDLNHLDERYDVVFDTVGNLTIRTGRPLLRDGGSHVFLVEGDTVRQRTVEPGARRGDRVEIRAGLAPGERVVESGVAFLADGVAVRVVADAAVADAR